MGCRLGTDLGGRSEPHLGNYWVHLMGIHWVSEWDYRLEIDLVKGLERHLVIRLAGQMEISMANSMASPLGTEKVLAMVA